MTQLNHIELLAKTDVLGAMAVSLLLSRFAIQVPGAATQLSTVVDRGLIQPYLLHAKSCTDGDCILYNLHVTDKNCKHAYLEGWGGKLVCSRCGGVRESATRRAATSAKHTSTHSASYHIYRDDITTNKNKKHKSEAVKSGNIKISVGTVSEADVIRSQYSEPSEQGDAASHGAEPGDNRLGWEALCPPALNLADERKVHVYPIKSNPAAKSKVNVWFSEVWEQVSKRWPAIAARFAALSGYTTGLYNDQATAALMAGTAYELAGIPDGMLTAIRMLHDPAGAKQLNVVIKACGAASARHGAMLAEGLSLQGRGIAPLDLNAEVRARTGSAGESKPVQGLDYNRLRMAIRGIIDDELIRNEVVDIDPVEFWNRRWLWSVNGAHSKVLERERPALKVPVQGRVHRRVAMESWSENPLDTWDGYVFVTASEKLEHGKTRLLLAGDTMSYVCFTHLFETVERAWANRRVLLDPGKPGQSGIASKVRRLGTGLKLMLDYDDFNSQHTLRAQQMVIEELCAACDYRHDYTTRLVSSFDRMFAYVDGKVVGRITGTLMSGHRGTTVLNSILNAAYVRYAAPDMWRSFNSLHTGDDVVADMPSYRDLEVLLENMKSAGFRLNPMKQGIGRVCAEFLRMVVTKQYAMGYCNRSIASCISGNWTTEGALSSTEAIRVMVQHARSLINRTQLDDLSTVLVPSVSRLTGLKRKLVAELLAGRVAVGEGPCYTNNGTWEGCFIEAAASQSSKVSYRSQPKLATTAYLSNALSNVELRSIELARTSVVDMMLDASYSKSLAHDPEVIKPAQLRARRVKTKLSRGLLLDREVQHLPAVHGVLEGYPIAHLLKTHLTNQDLCELLHLAGVMPDPDDVYRQAWGSDAVGVIIRGRIPYSDASAICNRVGGVIVNVLCPTLM